jgi:hypothetical protein
MCFVTPREVLEFLRKHRLGVLATTSRTGDPQSALVGIAVTDQFEIVFDTLNRGVEFLARDIARGI